LATATSPSFRLYFFAWLMSNKEIHTNSPISDSLSAESPPRAAQPLHSALATDSARCSKSVPQSRSETTAGLSSSAYASYDPSLDSTGLPLNCGRLLPEPRRLAGAVANPAVPELLPGHPLLGRKAGRAAPSRFRAKSALRGATRAGARAALGPCAWGCPDIDVAGQ
jgi:hypothetical protein